MGVSRGSLRSTQDMQSRNIPKEGIKGSGLKRESSKKYNDREREKI